MFENLIDNIMLQCYDRLATENEYEVHENAYNNLQHSHR